MKKPKCKVEKCNNDGMFFIAGNFVCGECVSKLYFKNQQKIMEDLNNASN